MADTAAKIKRVAIIGAGVMGGGIAAQMADAGLEVTLLDLVPEGATNRNALAEAAVKTQRESSPPGFVYPSRAGLITCGNLEDDLGKLKDCDWIIEAVNEDVRIKQDIYRNIDANRKPGSIVSSNTSTLSLATLSPACRKLHPRFHDHAFLQPAALHAIARNRAERQHAPGQLPATLAASPTCRLVRLCCSVTIHRASSPIASAATG